MFPSRSQPTESPEPPPPTDNSGGGNGASPLERRKAAEAGTSLREPHPYSFARKGYYGSFVSNRSFRGRRRTLTTKDNAEATERPLLNNGPYLNPGPPSKIPTPRAHKATMALSSLTAFRGQRRTLTTKNNAPSRQTPPLLTWPRAMQPRRQEGTWSKGSKLARSPKAASVSGPAPLASASPGSKQ